MYLTSMSVFLSSSAIISRWNLLNFRWGGRGRRGVRRGIKETRTHANDQRAKMRDGARRAIVVNGQAVKRRRVSGRRTIIRGVSLCARRGERRVRGCAYEWVRKQSVGKTPLLSVLLPLISARVGKTLAVTAALVEAQSTCQRGVRRTDWESPSVPGDNVSLTTALSNARWRSSCIISPPDETPWLIHSSSFTYQPTQRCCRRHCGREALATLLQTHSRAYYVQEENQF